MMNLKKKYFINSIWLITDRALFLFGSFFISVYVGRYLGPTKLGIITYALSVSAILVAITELGANHTIYNRVSKNKKSAIKLIENTVLLRGGIFFFTAILIVLFFLKNISNNDDLVVSIVIVISSFFTGLDTYQYYYNATLNSKINAISSQIAFVVVLLLRYFFVKYSLDFIWFSLTFFIQPFLVFIIRYSYFKTHIVNKINGFKNNKLLYCKYTINTGLPLLISALSIVLYTKINTFIIQYILGDEYVGYFSVALQLGLIWLFIPNSIIMSLLTEIISKKDEQMTYGISFIVLIILAVSIPFIVFFFFCSDFVIMYTYGIKFITSSELLYVISISGIFSCIGYLNNRILSSLGLYEFLLTKTLIVAVISIPSSILFIINYGLIGAALNVLIIEFISATFINYYKCKQIMDSQLKILNGFLYKNF